jgi:RNA polymerase sigma-70 factor (ECF subfamily)
MSPDEITSFLESLNGGDTAAVEQAFLTYAPYLQVVVRRQMPPQLRAKCDSADIVQSVWVSLLDDFRQGRWHFADEAHLRRFLAKVARYRLLNRLHRQAVERERPLGPTAAEALPASQARPSAEARAAELWDHILECCPPAHREIVRLRREGVPLAEIASWTGLHESSVRRILYDLARAVALRDKPRGPRAGRSSGG